MASTLGISEYFDVNQTFVNCTCLVLNATATADEPKSNAKKLKTLKIVLIVILGIGHLVFSLVPWMIKSGPLRKKLVRLMDPLMALAAGVILGAGFSHLIPDSEEGFQSYFERARPNYKHADYPFAQLVAVATLLLLVWLDKMVVEPLAGVGHDDDHGHAAGHHGAAEMKKFASSSTSCNEDCPPDCECKSNPGSSQSATPKDRGRAVLFFSALTVHGIFEGLSLGAAEELDTFVGLLIAITAHKMLDGLALGITVYNGRLPFSLSLMLLCICAAMTPLGIGIGWACTKQWNGAGADAVRGVVFGMTCGCFIFITLIELLPAALANRKHLVWKLLLLSFGWGAMALIALWT